MVRRIRPALGARQPTSSTTSAISVRAPWSSGSAWRRRRPALQVRFGRRWAYAHFAGLPSLLIDARADPGWRRNLAAEPACAPDALREAQALLSLRMRHADRRLSACQLTAAGVAGSYDPLPAAFPRPASLPG